MIHKEQSRVIFGAHDTEKISDHLKTLMPSLYFDDGVANGDFMDGN